MRRYRVLLRGVLPLCVLVSFAQRPQTEPHLVMISVDGMMPSAYAGADTRRQPTLTALAKDGAYADGVVGVLPSVTYASHTTMITGVLPAVHGILGNMPFDPEEKFDDAWYWYSRQIQVPTLIGAAHARGLSTAAVSWPVSVGMEADYLVPEYWRPHSSDPSDALMLRAIATKGLLDEIEAAKKSPIGWPLKDQDLTDIATHIIRVKQPRLLLLHLVGLDSAEHSAGPGSPRAADTLEQMDGYVRRVRDAIAQTPAAAQTYLVIVSDHGFTAIEHQLQPNALFKAEGLLEVDAAGKVTDWQAYYHAEGGSGFVHLRDPNDQALADRVGKLLDGLARDPANGIASIWNRSDLAKAGAEPLASYGIGLKPGWYSGVGHDALLVPTRSRGGHGFDPNLPELHASLIINGPAARGRGSLGIVRMTQIGPTLARLIGVTLSDRADAPIDLARATR